MLARFLFLTTFTAHLRFSIAQTCSRMSTESQNEAKLHSIAFVTTPNETVAKEIARGLIKNKFAACVNIIPGLTSVYEWEGEVNEDSEVLMMIKTRTSRMAELTEFVVQHHPYKVCEVISSNIDDGNLPYLKWISDSVPEKK